MVRPACLLLRSDAHRVVVLLQQPPEGRGAHRMPRVCQALTRVAPTPAHPRTHAHRIACGFGVTRCSSSVSISGSFFSIVVKLTQPIDF
jgi:hypothetical protein